MQENSICFICMGRAGRVAKSRKSLPPEPPDLIIFIRSLEQAQLSVSETLNQQPRHEGRGIKPLSTNKIKRSGDSGGRLSRLFAAPPAIPMWMLPCFIYFQNRKINVYYYVKLAAFHDPFLNTIM
jgi:hypothetical protein